jgi:hypothetical protein
MHQDGEDYGELADSLLDEQLWPQPQSPLIRGKLYLRSAS